METRHSSILVALDQPEKFVEKTLKSFSRNKHPSRVWLQSFLLSDHFRDDHEAFEKLEGLFRQIIKDQLDTVRQAVGIRDSTDIETNYYGFRDRYKTEAAFQYVLQMEIGGVGKIELQALKVWSTLYHKYFVFHHLNDEQFSRLTTLSSRQIRNYKKEGIEWLTTHLIEKESQIQSRVYQQHQLRPQNFIEHEAGHLIELARIARGIHGEKVALEKCDVAIGYAMKNQLARYLVEAVSLKVFTLLQGKVSNVEIAAKALDEMQKHDIIQSLPETPLHTLVMAKIASMWAHIWRRRGDLQKACDSAEQSILWVNKLQGIDPDIEKDVYMVSGIMYWASGNYDYAEQRLMHIINEKYPHVHDTHGMLGLVNWSRCRYDNAEYHFNLAIEQAKSLHDLWNLACEQGNLGLVYLSRCQLGISETYVKQHRENAHKLQSWKEHGRATANLGIINLHQGHYDTAIELLETAKILYDNLSARQSQVVIYSNLSQAHTLIGKHEQALEFAHRCYDIALSINGAYSPRLIALRCLAECELVAIEKRIHYLQSALEITDDCRTYDRAACLLALSRLITSPSEKSEYEKRGYALLQQIGATRWFDRNRTSYPHMLLIT